MASSTSPGVARVLVIEDDPAQREVLCEHLTSAGFRASGTANGAAALELLCGGVLPDLIVLDLLMPSMDGWTFRLEQRKHAAWARIPVIALSSDGGPQAAAIDAAAFLPKPAQPGRLVELVRQLIAATARERMDQMEKLATLGLLAAGVAHEINNPLAFTLSNLNFALEELEGWEKTSGEMVPVPRSSLAEVISALSEATEGAGRVKGLVTDLRAFSRSEEPQRKTVNLETVAHFAIKLATPQTKHRAEVLTEFGDAPRVTAEEPKLVQLLLNLIVNAAQAMPSERERPGRIVVRTGRTPQGSAFIEVEDSGEGIPPGLRERIFEPFFSTKPPGVGTGLGLSICRRIAQEHGGELTVASELGRGSRFRLELPAAAEEKSASPE